MYTAETSFKIVFVYIVPIVIYIYGYLGEFFLTKIIKFVSFIQLLNFELASPTNSFSLNRPS